MPAGSIETRWSRFRAEFESGSNPPTRGWGTGFHWGKNFQPVPQPQTNPGTYPRVSKTRGNPYSEPLSSAPAPSRRALLSCFCFRDALARATCSLYIFTYFHFTCDPVCHCSSRRSRTRTCQQFWFVFPTLTRLSA